MKRSKGTNNPDCNPAGRAGSFGRDTKGHAMIEFGLLLPIMAGLVFGVAEFSEAFTVNRRLSIIANFTGDLVAQGETITTPELDALVPMVDEIIKPYDPAPIGIVITSVLTDENNNATVDWSYADGPDASADASGSAYSLPEGVAEPNSSIVVAKAKYNFSSPIGFILTGNAPFEHVAYLRPRSSQTVVKTD